MSLINTVFDTLRKSFQFCYFFLNYLNTTCMYILIKWYKHFSKSRDLIGRHFVYICSSMNMVKKYIHVLLYEIFCTLKNMVKNILLNRKFCSSKNMVKKYYFYWIIFCTSRSMVKISCWFNYFLLHGTW